MRSFPIIAIDGPAGTGKTTSAAGVARRLGFTYIDSGALYRAIAVAAHRRGITTADDPALTDLLRNLPVRASLRDHSFRVHLGDEDVSERLRDPDVTSLASKLAVRADVRSRVGIMLRDLVRQGPAVVEGRDIGTAVFPDADLKIYLTADLPVRARRRSEELGAQGKAVPVVEVERQMRERDARDSGREIAPLRCAADAIEVDTSHVSIEQQVDRIVEAWMPRARRSGRSVYALEQALIRGFVGRRWGLAVEGVRNVPRRGPVILAANHKSYLDPPLIGSCLPREIHYLAKRELFSVPLLAWWIRAHNAIPIDRTGFDRDGIERALGILRDGGALLVFPEGTRIRSDGFAEPKEGIAWLVARAEVPVIPVYVRGTWAGQRSGRPGILVRFGIPFRFDPVPPGRAGRAQFPAIAERIMAEIRRLAEPPPRA